MSLCYTLLGIPRNFPEFVNYARRKRLVPRVVFDVLDNHAVGLWLYPTATLQVGRYTLVLHEEFVPRGYGDTLQRAKARTLDEARSTIALLRQEGFDPLLYS